MRRREEHNNKYDGYDPAMNQECTSFSEPGNELPPVTVQPVWVWKRVVFLHSSGRNLATRLDEWSGTIDVLRVHLLRITGEWIPTTIEKDHEGGVIVSGRGWFMKHQLNAAGEVSTTDD